MKRIKVALPTYQNRLSPLFDVAGTFEIYIIEKGKILHNYLLNTLGIDQFEKVDLLKNEKVELIICGAISRCITLYAESEELKILSGIIGNVDEVLLAYMCKNLKKEKYIMPGKRGYGRRKKGCPYPKTTPETPKILIKSEDNKK